MGRINVLDISVANLIAAGEVVERPSSAVKELVENAIDAGATQITVEIARGGISLIRVTDNGCGMSGEDAVLAIRRHATSKLKNASDLDAIFTLGFRGEALAAITAVSKFRLVEYTRYVHSRLLLLNGVHTAEDRNSLDLFLCHCVPLFLWQIRLDTVSVAVLRLLHFNGCQVQVAALFAEEHSVAIIDRDNQAAFYTCLALQVLHKCPLEFEAVDFDTKIAHSV